MYLQRNKNHPKKPATIDDVVIAGPYTRTTEDDIFLLADVQQNSERVIIFNWRFLRKLIVGTWMEPSSKRQAYSRNSTRFMPSSMEQCVTVSQLA